MVRQKPLNRIDISLDNLPEGKYNIQVLWDQNEWDSGINVPGNLYSESFSIDLKENKKVELPLSKITEPEKLAENKYLKEVDIKSRCFN